MASKVSGAKPGMTHTESGGDANDDSLALQLLGEVDLVAGGVLDQDIEIGDGIALLNKRRDGVVEKRPLGQDARNASGQTASGEHCELMN